MSTGLFYVVIMYVCIFILASEAFLLIELTDANIVKQYEQQVIISGKPPHYVYSIYTIFLLLNSW